MSPAVWCLNSGAYSGTIDTTIDLSTNGSTVTLEFGPGLLSSGLDADTCTISLYPGTCFCIQMIPGDVNPDRVTSPGDASLIKPHFGETANQFNAKFDYNADGIIGTVDFTLVKLRIGSTAPACP